MSLKNGLVFAMEDDEVIAPAADAVEMVPETQAEVETASAEVSEQSAEIEQIDTAVDEAQADTATVDSIADVMAETVESGEGMPEEAAQIAEVAVEALCARLGMRLSKKPMPAMESFGSTSSRLMATKIALEEVQGIGKRIWENIKKALAWVWEKITSFFKMITKNRDQLIKHLEQLKKSVAAAKENAEAKPVTGGVVKAFNVDGKTDFGTAKEVLAASDKLLKIGETISKSTIALTHKLTSGDVAADQLEQSLLSWDLGNTETLSGLGAVKGNKGGKDAKHFGNLSGGRSVSVVSKKMFGLELTTVGIADNAAEAAKEAPVLSKAEMDQLLTQAIATVKSLQAYEKVEKDLQATNKACQGVVDKYLSGAKSGAKDAEGSKHLNMLQATFNSANKAVVNMAASFPAAVFQAAKSAGDYVSASLAAHGGKAKKEPEAKKAE
jgi:hypothetical protein